MKDYHDETDDDEIGDATGERGISARGAAGCRSNDEGKMHPTIHEVSCHIKNYGVRAATVPRLHPGGELKDAWWAPS